MFQITADIINKQQTAFGSVRRILTKYLFMRNLYKPGDKCRRQLVVTEFLRKICLCIYTVLCFNATLHVPIYTTYPMNTTYVVRSTASRD